MNKRIVADGIEIDLFDEVDLNITYSIEDILDLEVRTSDFSKDFTIPKTGNNDRFFNYIKELNGDNTKNFLKAIPCQVYWGENVILNGSLRLIAVRNEVYQVALTGRFRDLITELDNLKSIDLSQYNHIRNSQNIIASYEYTVIENGSVTQKPEPGQGYVYPYIVNGQSNDIYDQQYIWDSYPAVYLKTIVDAIFREIGWTYESKFLESDYFKQLIIPWCRDYVQNTENLIRERTLRVGLDPETANTTNFQWNPGSGVIIDNTQFVAITPIRRRATSWWNSNALSNRFRLNDTSSEVLQFDEIFQFTDILGHWDQLRVGFLPPPVGSFDAGRYTCKKTGIYNIQLIAFVFPQYYHDFGATIRYNDAKLGFEYNYRLVHLKNNGSTVMLDQTDGTQFFNPGDNTIVNTGIDLSDTPPNMQPWRLSADNLFLEEGDRLEIRYSFRFPSLNFIGNNNDISCRLVLKREYNGEFSRFIVTPSENRTFGNEPVDMNQALPQNVSYKELFLDIVKLFNLIVATDKNVNNKVVIEPREDYWNSRVRVHEWKYDQLSPLVVKPMSEVNFKRYKFSYRPDSDYLNLEYRNETGQEWGQRLIKIENDYSQQESTLGLSFFSPTPLTNLYTNDRLAPYFVNKELDEIRPRIVNPRLLFYTGLKPCQRWFLKSNINGAGQELLAYPYCGPYDDPSLPQYDLGFGSTEKIYHNINRYPKNNVFNKFHRSTFNQLIDLNNKIMEASFYLKPNDISDFDFRDVIFIDGGYWRVNKIIDYDPENKLTKVQLYKINLDKTYNIQSIRLPISNRSCPTDIQVIRPGKEAKGDNRTYYSSPNGPIDEDCCTLLGGYFIGGVCYTDRPDDTGVPIDDGITPVVTVRSVYDFTDFNSINTVGVAVNGKGNYISKDSGIVSVVGKDTSSIKGSKDSYAFGDGITVDKPKTFYVNDVAIDKDGDLVNVKPYIVHGGKNTTLPASRSNLIEMVHGGVNAARNSGGDQKKRIILADEPIIEFGPDMVRPFIIGNGSVEIYQTRKNNAALWPIPLPVFSTVLPLTLDNSDPYNWFFDFPTITGTNTTQSLPADTDYSIKRNGNWVVRDPANNTLGNITSIKNACPQGEYSFLTVSGDIEWRTILRFYGCGEFGPLGKP